MHVLIVEDNPGDAFLINDLLVRALPAGTQVQCAPRLSAALEACAASTFDVALLDLSLPDSSGINAVLSLAEAKPDLPVVVLTGTSSNDTAMSAVQGGAQDYLVKGHFDEGILARSISYAIERAHGRAELRQARDFLQERVEERTAELAQVVEQLRAEIIEREQIQESLRQAKEAADAANVAKSQFLAMMSHELRTPLNGLLGMLELLLIGELTAEQRDRAGKASSSGRMLLQLINDILDLAKFEGGHFALRAQPFNLGAALDSAALCLQELARAKNLDLHVDLAHLLPQAVVGDELRIQQVVTNLLGNAVKFTDKGNIALEARTEWIDGNRCGVLVQISDTGVGISEADQGRVFDLFTQVDASHKRAFMGTGLGLSICKRLVESMDGSIGVQSRESLGSTFWFRLPLEHVPLPSAGRESTTSPRVHLAIDSTLQLSAEVRALLQHGGVEATWVSSAEAAGLEATKLGTYVDTQVAVLVGEAMWTNMQIAAQQGNTRRTSVWPAIVVLTESSVFRRASCDTDAERIYLAAPLAVDALRTLLALLAEAPCSTEQSCLRDQAGHCASQVADHTGLRILLADDNDLSREAVKLMLTSAGYACHAVANGRAAVEAVQDKQFDLVFMDFHMPLMDGLEATRAIRAWEDATSQYPHKSRQRVPIVALTASAMASDDALCRDAGMDGYITKPIGMKDLVAAVERFGRVDDVSSSQRGMSSATPSSTPLERGSPIDVDALAARWRGDRGLINSLCSAFLLQAIECRNQLAPQRAGGDASALLHVIHNLKGSAAFVQALDLRDMAAMTEHALRSMRLEAADAQIRALVASVDECLAYMLECVAGEYGPFDDPTITAYTLAAKSRTSGD